MLGFIVYGLARQSPLSQVRGHPPTLALCLSDERRGGMPPRSPRSSRRFGGFSLFGVFARGFAPRTRSSRASAMLREME